MAAILADYGLSFAWNVRPEPAYNRRADFVFELERVAVFVDGCFWHGCPSHSRIPTNNGPRWAAKISRNRERDLETTNELSRYGWLPLRIWSHVAPNDAADLVAVVLRARVHSGTGGLGQ